jgi:tripeptide aminopeptidase
MHFDQNRRLLQHWLTTPRWDGLPDIAEFVFQQALTIQSIPAPTFEESTRAEYMQRHFLQAGLDSVSMDERFNVYGCLNPPSGASPDAQAVMVVAHTDTVFPQETDLSIRYEQDLVYGAGLGDNSLGSAALLGLIESLKRIGHHTGRKIWFVATSREEGLGDLGGMRLAFDTLKDQIGVVLNIEGMALGHVYHEAIAVRRLHITAHAEGGHSWAHYGRKSAIHGLMQLGAKITQLIPPEHPRTTYNIGVIEGGQSVNTIATDAGMWLDLRSESSAQLESFEAKIRERVAACQADDLTFDITVVGDRPSGAISSRHPLVEMCMLALEKVGIRGALANGSTDGNISLAAGCPTVTLGVTRGGNAHRLDEYIERSPIEDGMYQLLGMLIALSSQTDG